MVGGTASLPPAVTGRIKRGRSEPGRRANRSRAAGGAAEPLLVAGAGDERELPERTSRERAGRRCNRRERRARQCELDRYEKCRALPGRIGVHEAVRPRNHRGWKEEERGGGRAEEPGKHPVSHQSERPDQVRDHREPAAHPAQDEVHGRPHVPERLTTAHKRVVRIAPVGVAHIVHLVRVPTRGGRGHLVEVADLGVGPELRVHLEVGVLRRKVRDVAVRVREIAEVQGLGNAGRGAGRGGLEVEPGHDVRGLRRRVDLVHAERALGRDPHAFLVEDLLLLPARRPEVPRVLVGDGPGLVGTRDRAIAAADAGVVVHGHEPVGPLARRPPLLDSRTAR